MKAFTAFWANDFTTKPSPKELLVDDYDNPVSARQALSMDIYEARALAKAVMAESELSVLTKAIRNPLPNGRRK